jgi:hypothetical protein
VPQRYTDPDESEDIRPGRQVWPEGNQLGEWAVPIKTVQQIRQHAERYENDQKPHSQEAASRPGPMAGRRGSDSSHHLADGVK